MTIWMRPQFFFNFHTQHLFLSPQQCTSYNKRSNQHKCVFFQGPYYNPQSLQHPVNGQPLQKQKLYTYDIRKIYVLIYSIMIRAKLACLWKWDYKLKYVQGHCGLIDRKCWNLRLICVQMPQGSLYCYSVDHQLLSSDLLSCPGKTITVFLLDCLP